jgi:hypothetical protein
VGLSLLDSRVLDVGSEALASMRYWLWTVPCRTHCVDAIAGDPEISAEVEAVTETLAAELECSCPMEFEGEAGW